MQGRYYWHPERHQILEKFFLSMRDRTRANNLLLNLSEALVRNERLNLRELSLLGVQSSEEDFKFLRIRISATKYPSLFQVYRRSSSRLRGFILGEIFAETLRFREKHPDAAGMLLLNLEANVEEVGDAEYPTIEHESLQTTNSSLEEQSAVTREEEDYSSRVNGLGADILDQFNNGY